MNIMCERVFFGDGVTVVVAYYNRSLFLERLLKSIFNQTLKPTEIFIIDNGSREDDVHTAWSIIESFKVFLPAIEIVFVSTLKRYNANYARNLGLELAKTRYIAFLDSDDWWEPEHLKCSLEILRNSDNSAVYGGAFVSGVGRKTIKSFDISETSGAAEFLFGKRQGFAQTSSYVVDKEKTYPEIAWDEKLKRNQDYDYFFLIQNKSDGWVYSGHITTNIDWNNGGTKKSLSYKSMVYFYKRWKDEFKPEETAKYISFILESMPANNSLYYRYFRRLFIDASKSECFAYFRTSIIYLRYSRIFKKIIKKSLERCELYFKIH
jgi:glycosyltransferase involved in cell wall biosynthesis